MFYTEDGSIISCTENAVEPIGQSLEALARDIEAFQEALTLPVLRLDDIPMSTSKKCHDERQKNMYHEQLMVELGLSEPSTTKL